MSQGPGQPIWKPFTIAILQDRADPVEFGRLGKDRAPSESEDDPEKQEEKAKQSNGAQEEQYMQGPDHKSNMQ